MHTGGLIGHWAMLLLSELDLHFWIYFTGHKVSRLGDSQRWVFRSSTEPHLVLVI